ncbi:MAG: chromosomal replication initiator protein DnaA [Candidatus Bipolaricaulia bacterium]
MSASLVAVWDSVVSTLRDTIPDSSYLTWLADARPLALGDDSLAIGVPDSFTKNGIERRYRAEIERLVSETCKRPVSLEVNVLASDSPAAISARRAQEEARTIPRGGFPLNVDYTFDSYVRGKNNHLAHAASEAVAHAVIESEEKTYNPLFIYGNVGLGKTHLLQAIGNQVLGTARDRTVVYTTSERFAIELINGIRNNSTGAFREKYRKIDLLLIDDVHFLQGKEATQEELFHTFNELYGAMKQIVLSSDRPPEDLSGLQERLVSRFRWGLVADIQAPDLETRIAILREKAIARGLSVDDDVLELIARRISSNVRALEGALVKALACAKLQGERLTPQRLEAMLPKEGQRPRLTIDHIKEEVATHYNLKGRDLESSSRKKEISQARHVAIFLARKMTDHSFPAIGREFGNRDHTTIMHSYSKVRTQLEETPLLQAEIGELQESLASRFALHR